THLPDQRLDRLALRDEGRRPHDRTEIPLAIPVGTPEVTCQDDADHIVDRALVDGEPQVPLLDHHILRTLYPRLYRDRDDLRPRCHHLAHADLAQPHHIRDDLPLVLLERALTS